MDHGIVYLSVLVTYSSVLDLVQCSAFFPRLSLKNTIGCWFTMLATDAQSKSEFHVSSLNNTLISQFILVSFTMSSRVFRFKGVARLFEILPMFL